ncbi:DUF763 domain-containing protein [Methanobacterium petrolearium]|uniref:DUF763 domain-containing protein n=1 Tax=Methanobacterium petrolearium TaxID=710190 RepID=UPI001AEAD4A1|nr:DUF763 domain-containing protein [Methanobacterium petrolearium]MBP1946935.1 hypothetical protein [Methanobacterium petrolearium]
MSSRSGIANLPLHGGKAPRWLFQRMVKLAGAITEAVIYEYGANEFLYRISDPHWFQAFSCVLGFDWHSSGTTTTTCGALKTSINPEKHGILIAGGKGRTSRQTPREIQGAGELFSLSEKKLDGLVYSSKISAKIDNSCIQDGYQLYHHVFFLTEKGKWAVVQQGMNESTKYARRYHWLSDSVENYINEPHTGICCDLQEKKSLDMTSDLSYDSRQTSLDLVLDNPEHLKKYFQKKPQIEIKQTNLDIFCPELTLPRHHPVLDTDLSCREFEVLKKAWELQPESYEELVSLKGMGPKKIRALALISDLVYGDQPSWDDPVKYSFTHGGKDGFPYPVDREVYDHSIRTLKDALEQARLEKKDRYQAIKRLENLIGQDNN